MKYDFIPTNKNKSTLVTSHGPAVNPSNLSPFKKERGVNKRLKIMYVLINTISKFVLFKANHTSMEPIKKYSNHLNVKTIENGFVPNKKIETNTLINK